MQQAVRVGFDVLLQYTTRDDADHKRCEGFAGIPVMRPTRVFVVAANKDTLQSNAELARELGLVLDKLHPTVKRGTPACGGSTDSLYCGIDMLDGAASLLVWVGNADAPQPVPIEILREGLRFGWKVMAVLPATVNPDRVLPTELQGAHAFQYRNQVSEAIGEVLAASGIVPRESRLFVSYRHADGRDVAEALFHKLLEARFDVFLDRFALFPGDPFAEQIEQDLLDKAFVVVIESATAAASAWIQREVMYAVAHRLGLAALNIDGAPPVPQILPERRLAVQRAGPAPTPPETITAFVQLVHAQAMLQRREVLDNSMRMAVSGAASAVTVAGGIDVVGQFAEYAINYCPRSADVTDFQSVHTRATPKGAVPALLGSPAVTTERRELLRWLADRTGVRHVDEARVVEFGRAILTGGPLPV